MNTRSQEKLPKMVFCRMVPCDLTTMTIVGKDVLRLLAPEGLRLWIDGNLFMLEVKLVVRQKHGLSSAPVDGLDPDVSGEVVIEGAGGFLFRAKAIIVNNIVTDECQTITTILLYKLEEDNGAKDS